MMTFQGLIEKLEKDGWVWITEPFPQVGTDMRPAVVRRRGPHTMFFADETNFVFIKDFLEEMTKKGWSYGILTPVDTGHPYFWEMSASDAFGTQFIKGYITEVPGYPKDQAMCLMYFQNKI